MLESLIVRWGYLAIVAGTFLEGETILLVGGAVAHRGLLSLPLVMVAAFAGGVSGDQLWFQLGKRYGRQFIERRPAWKARAERVDLWLSRYGVGFILGFRFVYGVRTVTPAFLGASSYPSGRFGLFNAVGGALWAVTFALLGWVLSASLELLLQRASQIEELLAGSAGLMVCLWLLRTWLRHRAEKTGTPPRRD